MLAERDGAGTETYVSETAYAKYHILCVIFFFDN
jgi:hypothetical protein